MPLVNRMTKAFSGWLAPAYGGGVELKADLDQVEGLAAEREALWARLNAATFLTVNEKRAAVGYAPVDLGSATVTPEAKAGFDPNQPRVPAGSEDGGQWTDGGGGSSTLSGTSRSRESETQVTQARTTRRITVGGQTFTATPRQETELRLAESRLASARNRIKELDPEWHPRPSLRRTQLVDVEQRIRGLRDEAQEIEARITVIERGGVALGFDSREDFQRFGLTTRGHLRSEGQSDAEPVLRGSAVTGYKYTTGRPFDGGREPSDLDLAIVSPRLFRRAQELGVEIRGRTRTMPIEQHELRRLGLDKLIRDLTRQTGRKNSIVIFQSRQALEQRGPFLDLPAE